MALWQFISFFLPMGGLLVYVGVLTTRVGLANAQLKKITEALQSLERKTVPADAASAEVRTGASAHSGSEHGTYQTIRNLRSNPTPSTSPVTVGPSSPAYSPAASAQDTKPVQVARRVHRSRKVNGATPAAPPEHPIEVYIPPYLRIGVSSDPPEVPSIATAISSAANPTQPPGSGTRGRGRARKSRTASSGTSAHAMNSDTVVEVASDGRLEEVIAAATEIRCTAETTEAHAPVVEEAAVPTPALPAADEADDLAKIRTRDTLVFMNNQRRRRRMQRAS